MGDLVTFWARVDHEVEQQRTSYRWLADELGVNESTVSTWRTRGTLPRVDEALRISYLLGVSVDFLVYGKGPMLVPERLKGLCADLLVLPPEKLQDVARLIHPWALEARCAGGREREHLAG